MAGTLKEEEGSEDLPGQGATRSAVDRMCVKLEKPLIDKSLKGGTAMLQKMPIKPPVNSSQIARVVKGTVKKATAPQGEGNEMGMPNAHKTRKSIPGDLEGKLEKNGFQEEAGGKGGFPPLIFPILIQLFLEGVEDGFDQAPLRICEDGINRRSGVDG